MNAIFGLNIQVSVGESMLVAVAVRKHRMCSVG